MEAILTVIIVIIIVLVLWRNENKKKNEREIDAKTDYSNEDLGGSFHPRANGDTWLVFPYKPTQKKKKEYILSNYH